MLSKISEPTYEEMKKSVAVLFPWFNNLDFYATWQCDKNCVHCISADMKREGVQYLDQRLHDRTVDTLDGLGSVHYTGGEPFEHPKIFDFIYKASEKVHAVKINTNGSWIPLDNREARSFFKQFPKGKMHFFISVDEYHGAQDSDLKERIKILRRCAKRYGHKVSFNLRVSNKEDEVKKLKKNTDYPE